MAEAGKVKVDVGWEAAAVMVLVAVVEVMVVVATVEVLAVARVAAGLVVVMVVVLEAAKAAVGRR